METGRGFRFLTIEYKFRPLAIEGPVVEEYLNRDKDIIESYLKTIEAKEFEARVVTALRYSVVVGESPAIVLARVKNIACAAI